VRTARLALLLLAAGLPAAAAEVPPGASACAGCHGVARANAAIPSLRGRAAEDVATALREFREGRRPATLMDRLAKGFSDAESQAIAAWVVQ
jgi:cytochrome c553